MQHYTQGSHHFLSSDRVNFPLKPELFDPDYLKTHAFCQQAPAGRGHTWFFTWDEDYYVLRHYSHGGFFGRLLSDRYLYRARQNTRPWREWQVLLTLHAAKLNVPEPAAAHVHYHLGYYKADFVMRRIPEAYSVSQLLQSQGLVPELWARIGKAIREMHDLKVFHVDLNAHNILIDKQEKIWLIDFDRCYHAPMTESQRLSNLNRLKRSFVKLQRLLPYFHWNTAAWNALCKGYRSAY